MQRPARRLPTPSQKIAEMGLDKAAQRVYGHSSQSPTGAIPDAVDQQTPMGLARKRLTCRRFAVPHDVEPCQREPLPAPAQETTGARGWASVGGLVEEGRRGSSVAVSAPGAGVRKRMTPRIDHEALPRISARIMPQ